MNLNLTVMMYHYVRDVGDAAEAGSGIPGLPTQEFSAQVDQLAREYEMVGWDDVRGAVLEQKALPERACLLTFDDGVCDHYLNVFPELRPRNVSGLFFTMARRDENDIPLPHKLHYLIAHLGLERMREEIWNRLNETQRETYLAAEAQYSLRWKSRTDVVKGVFQRELAPEINPILTELLEQYVGTEPELARRLFLSEGQIREMRADGMHFGGHSQTHPWFDFIDATQREKEIRASREWLATVEQAPFAFAYPYGGLHTDAPHYLQQNDFRAAFTTHEQVEHTDAFYIGRFDGEQWNSAAHAQNPHSGFPTAEASVSNR
jgi:peptidoglycan/xylan/chitin deacetylase (PgdA/CDA1 family)